MVLAFCVVTMYNYHPWRLAKPNILKQYFSHGVIVVCDGSPSRMRRVRRISLGMTIRPRSSTRLTIPVAFISFPLLAVNSTVVLFAGNGELSGNILNVQTFFPVVNLVLDVACLISYRNICLKDSDGKLVRKQLEVDFVCNKGSKRYYIQSAFAIPDEAKLQQESNSLRRIDDSFKKIIVVKDTPAPWYTEEGILVISVYDFLLNADSLDI